MKTFLNQRGYLLTSNGRDHVGMDISPYPPTIQNIGTIKGKLDSYTDMCRYCPGWGSFHHSGRDLQ